jgi:hypothetical protein
MKYPEVRNYRDGSFVAGDQSFIDLYNPSDGSVISRVPMLSQNLAGCCRWCRTLQLAN